MKKPFFSILVAAYNVESYIAQCLESIKNQSFTDFEVIVVNDGSTDHTYNICRTICSSDSRFKLISHQQNSGLLLARKTAVTKATGSFILFVDGDDFLYTNESLNELQKAISNQVADIYRFTVTTTNCTKKEQESWNRWLNRKNPTINSSIDILEGCYKFRLYPWSLWSSCYRAETVKKSYVHIVDEHFTHCEDGYAFFIISCFAKKFVYLDLPAIYSYRIGSGVSTKKITKERFIAASNEIKCTGWIKDFLNKTNLDEKTRYLSCLHDFEVILANAFVYRLLSLNEIDQISILNSNQQLPTSNTITLSLIKHINKLKNSPFKLLRKKIKRNFLYTFQKPLSLIRRHQNNDRC